MTPTGQGWSSSSATLYLERSQIVWPRDTATARQHTTENLHAKNYRKQIETPSMQKMEGEEIREILNILLYQVYR